METLEVHSKDFLVKWINAPENSIIDWQAKPLKKSINFAIYKKNEQSSVLPPPAPKFLGDDTPSLNAGNNSAPPTNGSAEPDSSTFVNGGGRNRSNSNSVGANTANSRLRSASVVSVNELSESVSTIYKTLSRSNTRTSAFTSNLNNSDLTLVKDYKKLVSGELVHGKFHVKQGGIYAFIFDNSFSKSFGKKILFSTKIIQTRPESNGGSIQSVAVIEPSTASVVTNVPVPNNKSGSGSGSSTASASASVDPLDSSSLPNSGSVTPPTSKQQSSKDLESILRPKNGELLQGILLKRRRKKLQGFTKRFFVLNFKYGTLSYFKVNDNKLRGQMPIKHSIVSANSKNREIIIDSGMEAWDLKCSSQEVFKSWVQAFNQIKKAHYQVKESIPLNEAGTGTGKPDNTNLYVLNSLEKISGKLAILKQETTKLSSKGQVNDIDNDITLLIDYLQGIEEDSFYGKSTNNHNTSINNDNDNDEHSLFSNGDFYDAKEYLDAMNSGVVFLNEPLLDQQTGESIVKTKLNNSIDRKLKISDEEDIDEVLSSSDDELDVDKDLDICVVPESGVQKADDNDSNLYPLPIDTVIKRDSDIPTCEHSPPSILAFLRKNVGKDLSSVAMPVTMNEPLSTLQKYSELMEYCEIIDNAIQANCEASTGERILRIAAFAVSSLSSMRAKERNVRKPFTALLGETFELVREDFGIRMVSEKVIHRPPVFAIFVESKDWEFKFSPSPEQKFWGKNAEIITRGVAKLTIKSTGEVFLWTQPLTLLKGIIAGEKYGEPSTTLTVKSSSGYKAVVEFAKSGMFSGRLEDLVIQAYDNNKKQLLYEVVGKWTESLTLKTNTTERLIWSVGELLPNPVKKFGFTKFAGTLNKVTEIENGKIPPTDSRLRPDIKLYENGDVDGAEELKLQLEENQRHRRKELEITGKKYIPKFFSQDSKNNDTEWTYIRGDKSYWNRRQTGEWNDLIELW